MEIFKNIIKYIGSFIGIVAILLCIFIATVKYIPKEKIEDNINDSIKYIESKTEVIEVKPTREYSYLHVYADEILLNMIYCMDSNNPLKSVMEAKYYKDSNGLDYDIPTLEGAIENEGIGNQEYMRYWHGSMIIVRPLLMFFNINEIYNILAVVMIILIILLLAILLKQKEYLLIVATIVGYVMIAINYVPLCLEYVWTFLIMLNVSIISLFVKKYNFLFFVTGIITCFLDFLSTEIITLFVPMIYIYAIKYKNNEMGDIKATIKQLSKYTILWLLGYCLMWGAKWLLASIVLNVNALDYVVDKAMIRVNGQLNNYSTSHMIIYGILNNLKTLYPFYLVIDKSTIICIIACIVIPTVLIIKKDRKAILNFLLFMLIAITPYIRYIIMVNHSFGLYFFTFRDQLITIMSLIIGIGISIDKDKLNKEIKIGKKFVK